MRNRGCPLATAACYLLATTAIASAQVQVVTNGGFESGLAGWTAAPSTANPPAVTCGFNASNGTGTEPVSGNVTSNFAASGSLLAMGAGIDLSSSLASCVLYQDVALPLGASTATFNAKWALKRLGGLGSNQAALTMGVYSLRNPTEIATVPHYSTSTSNRIFRGTLYVPSISDSALRAATQEVFNVASYGGQTIRFAVFLALAAAGSGQFTVVGVDDVSLVISIVPVLTQSFGAPSILPGGVTSLTYTITNPATAPAAVTGVGFTNNLPAGLMVATPNGATGSCGGGTITAAAAATSVSLAGASLPIGGSCTFSVNVTATTTGTKNNSVTVTSSAGSSTASTASLSVVATPPTVTQVTPASGPLAGGNTVTITGTNFVGVSGVTIGGTAATGVTTVSPTSVTAVAPARGTAGAVSVVVTTLSGSNAANTLYSYLPLPVVTEVSPNSGPLSGGNAVTITGTGFTNASSVTFGGTPASSFTAVSATSITATVPASATAGAVSVVVTAPGGSNSANTLYTYVAAPTVTGVSPGSGPLAGGNAVTITGTNFTGATAVTFGGTPASSFTAVSATSITATVPASATAGAVSVVVTAPGGSSAANSLYTYVAAPTVTGVSPGSGPLAGGNAVTITGTNFTGATAVTFGGTPATSFTVDGATTISATVPASATAGAVGVVVTTSAGSNTANTLYTYVAGPTVTGVSPGSGPLAGGNAVTITGTNFTGATAVTFGGTPATSFKVDGATTISATVPASATAGAVSVVVTTPGGSNSANTLYTYVAAPTVTAVSPGSGPQSGGTTVTITGTNLGNASAVTFGGTAATSFTAVSATSITATAPASATAGAVSVVVTTPGGSSAANSLYTYVAAPTVTGVSPGSGPLAGGNAVTITGTNFTGATVVTFGGTPATSFTVDGATTISATVPASATAGAVSVVVTTPGGSNSANTLYTYVAAPTVTGVSPGSGPLAGGNAVTITGTNFTGATAVTFGGTPATSFKVDGATTISATVPASATAGAVSVVVTTPAGSNSANTLYTYVAAPIITSVTPASGPLAGGNTVTIAGSGFSGATSVTFGGTSATSFTAVSATSITATVPANATAGAVSVVVTTPAGSNTANTLYSYVAAPIITSVTPASGPLAGGNTVTIAGSGFSGATSVTFGGASATSFTIVSATSITAAVPANAAVGPVSVVVTTAIGSNAPNTLYSYNNAPTITGVDPRSGPLPGGNVVTITGAAFSGATSVTFGGTPATSFTVTSATSITAMVPSSALAGPVSVVVTTPTGANAPNSFYFYGSAPTITSVRPSSGPLGGGNTLTITGANFTGATSVTFGGRPATSFTVASATSISATVPAGAAEAPVSVVITAPTGSNPANTLYTYTSAPLISDLVPDSGPLSGGTIITITGFGFTGATSVTFGGLPAPNFTVVNDNTITVTVPGIPAAGSVALAPARLRAAIAQHNAAAAPSVVVVVTTARGSSPPPDPVAPDEPVAPSELAPVFTYAPAPTVTSVSPSAGPLTGGNTVTITGTDFVGVTSVTFGGRPATNVNESSTTSITATVPAGSAIGAVSVVVTTPSGSSSANTLYSYGPFPAITSISPASGPQTGGNAVTITGSNFNGATSVTFGGVSATNFIVRDANTITAFVPVSSVAGTVPVIVTTPTGSSAPFSGYAYVVPIPTLTEWGMIALTLLLVWWGWRRLRRQDGAAGAA